MSLHFFLPQEEAGCSGTTGHPRLAQSSAPISSSFLSLGSEYIFVFMVCVLPPIYAAHMPPLSGVKTW